MFWSHVEKQLSAYCNGEKDADESRGIAEHLIKCERCRKEYDKIKLGVELARHLQRDSAPEEIWAEIQQLIAKRENLAEDRRSTIGSFGRYRLAAVAAPLILLLVGIVVWKSRPAEIVDSRPPGSELPSQWKVQTTEGSRITGDRSLSAGSLIETASNETARISAIEIGNVDLEPNTPVRLVDTRVTEHRLALDRGTIHATIYAPPRLFFVDTPSAEAIDLGCAYTLNVDDQGRTFLKVTLGWVALVRGGLESYVPIGAMCQTRPGIGPGTPYFADASSGFVSALEKFDFEGEDEEHLKAVLSTARARDTFTLWHLIQRVDETKRQEVLNRMVKLVGMPKGVTSAGIMKLDKQMLELWKDELDTVWF